MDTLKARGLWPSSGPGSSRDGWELKATWRYFGPDGNRDQEDYDTPTGRERRWAGGKDGIKPRRLIAIARGAEDLPGKKYRGIIIICEGAKTADAAFKLTGAPAFGFASATTKGKVGPQLPDDDVIEWAGGSCASTFWIVPDNDVNGIKAGAIMARRLAGLYPKAKVKWIDPAKLIPNPPKGWDVADWVDPPADAIGHFVGACCDPPEPKDTGHHAAARTADRPAVPPTSDRSDIAPAAAGPVLSEHDLGELFVGEHGGDWRAQVERDRWLRWDDTEGWAGTMPGVIHERLAAFGKTRLQTIREGKVCIDQVRGGKLSTAMAASKIVRATSPVATHTGDWDAAHDLIGLPGGRVLEVVDGQLVERDRRREDLISKSLAARPNWAAGVWSDHVSGLFDDQSVASFLMALVGYSLLNRGTEDKIVLCPGRGGTGKTVTFDAITRALGGYGATVDPGAISSTRGQPVHPVGRMTFIGRRVVVSPELDSGCVLDAAFCKRISGGDIVKARGMYENETAFKFGGLLFVYTNAEPTLIAPDDGLKRRILVLPFEKKREHPDVNFGPRIDLSHVVGWMVAGAQFYLRNGLMATPASVVAASRAFHEDADPISAFCSKWLKPSPASSTPADLIFERYGAHCRETGVLKPLTLRTFNKRLREGGFGIAMARRNGVLWADGCTLRQDQEAA